LGTAKKLVKKATKIAKRVVPAAATLGLSEVRKLGMKSKTFRKLGAGALGLSGLGMVLQPEQMGIKNKESQAMYTRAQRLQRIATGAVAGIAGGMAAAPAFAGMGGSLAGMLPTTAGGWLGAGMKGLSLAKGAMGLLGGGAGGGDLSSMAGLYGAYQGYKGQEGALSDLAEQESRYGGNIARQEELAGLDPRVAAQMKRQAVQGLRGAQAERGIYESGVSAAQEAELMPQIEQSQRAWQLQQLAAINPQYQTLMETSMRRAGMYGTGEEAGAALAGGEEGGGGFDLASLAGKAWDWGSGLFGGNEDQGYDLGSSSLAGMGYGGTYY